MGDAACVAIMQRIMMLAAMFTLVVVALSESPIPFEEAEEVAPTLSLEEDLSSATRLSTLKNIRALKTYCITAKRKAVSLQDGVDSNKKGPIVDFIVKFGTPINAKQNIVSEYAKAMGRMKRKMKKGLHAYVMKNFDRAVVFGKGVVSLANTDGAGMYAFLDHKSVGLNSQPDYFKQLKVRYAVYVGTMKDVHEISKKADTKAAANYLIRQGKHVYAQYFRTLKNRNEHEHTVLWKKVTRGALKGQLKAWLKKKHLKPLVPGGILAAQKVVDRLWKKLQMPSEKKLSKMAKKESLAWMKSHKKSVSKVIAAMEFWASMSKKQRAARRKVASKAREARAKARYARIAKSKRKALKALEQGA